VNRASHLDQLGVNFQKKFKHISSSKKAKTCWAQGSGRDITHQVSANRCEGSGLQNCPLMCFLFGLTGMLIAHPRSPMPVAQSGLTRTGVNMFGIGGAFVLRWLIGAMVDAVEKFEGHTSAEAFSWAFGVLAVGTPAGFSAYRPWLKVRDNAPSEGVYTFFVTGGVRKG
jgi:hypothetical protein